MNNDYQVILKIINAGLKNEHLSLKELNGNKEVSRILKEQTFLPYLYKITQEEKVKNYYLLNALYNEQINTICLDIKTLFDKEHIKHIFLKGTSIKDLYDDSCLRALGDIDIYIDKNDLKKAHKTLKQHDFIYLERCDHHLTYIYHNVEIELHFNLISPDNLFYDFFKYPFDNAYQKNEYTYNLENNYNFIYIIVHYLNHIKEGGAGLRPICDMYILLTKTKIDLDYVKSIFQKYHYETFFNTIINVLNYIFEYNDYPFKENDNIETFIEYSLQAGIHGFGKNNQKIKNKQISSSKSKISYLFSQLFIPLKSLFSIYPWTKSIILIPIGYIFRLCHLLFKRKDKFVKLMKEEENSQLNSLLKQTGVINE